MVPAPPPKENIWEKRRSGQTPGRKSDEGGKAPAETRAPEPSSEPEKVSVPFVILIESWAVNGRFLDPF